jgi:RsiW-degrading membrane proteinase PrsW (M82 family)
VRVLTRRWFQIFAGGLVLLYLLERTLLATQSLNYVPSVLLLGAFLVPATFVTYLYERLPQWEVPLPPLAVCFFWGGALGTVVAESLEYDLLRSLGVLALLGVGLIEEGAGIVLGVSTAMGFAALETMGYGFMTLLQSQGNLVTLDEVLLARGLMSPAGHAAWTGLVCAVLWRERIAYSEKAPGAHNQVARQAHFPIDVEVLHTAYLLVLDVVDVEPAHVLPRLF